jgi:hypothetical protein
MLAGLGFLFSLPGLVVYFGGFFFIPHYVEWLRGGWFWFFLFLWAGFGIFPAGIVIGICEMPLLLLVKVFHIRFRED